MKDYIVKSTTDAPAKTQDIKYHITGCYHYNKT